MPEKNSTDFCTMHDREVIVFHAFTVMNVCLQNSFEYFYEALHGTSLYSQKVCENCKGQRPNKITRTTSNITWRK